MHKINEEELESIIRDVITEQMMLEATDEGVGGGLVNAGKQIWSDLKNMWGNAKQAYKYGSDTQNKEKEIRKNIGNTQNTGQPSSPTTSASTNTGNTTTNDNTTAQDDGNATPTPTTNNNATNPPQQTASAPQQNQDASVQQQPQNNGGTQQPKQPSKKQQVKSTMRTAWSQQRRGFAKQFIERDVVRIGKNYNISPNELAGQLEAIAKTLRTNPQQYFPQTNESRLSDEALEQLTEEIVARIKKG